MKVTCLAQSHLIQKDKLEQQKEPKKSPLMMNNKERKAH